MKKLILFLLMGWHTASAMEVPDHIEFGTRVEVRTMRISEVFEVPDEFKVQGETTRYWEKDLKTGRVYTVHNIGTGSGNITITSMTGYSAGDVAAIANGTYGYTQVRNMGAIHIYPATDSVTWTSNWDVSNNVGTDIDGSGGTALGWDPIAGQVTGKMGFIYQSINVAYGVFELSGTNKNMTFQGMKFLDCGSDVLGNQQNQTFLDTTDITGGGVGYYPNKKLLGSHLNYFWMRNSNAIMASFRAWYSNFVDSTEIAYCRQDSVGQQVVLSTQGQNFDLHDWYIGQQTAAPIAANHDMALIQVGPSKIHDMKWVGYNTGWFFGHVSTWATGTTALHYQIYNIAVIGHIHYGICDFRNDITNSTALQTFDVYISNCLLINCPTNQGFTQPIALSYGMNGRTLHARNCARANILDWTNSGTGFVTSRTYNFAYIYLGTNGTVVFDTAYASNVYVDNPISAAWWPDSVNCVPGAASPLRHAGTALTSPYIVRTYDLYHHLSPESGQTNWSIGPTEYYSAGGSTVTASAGSNQSINLPTNSVSLSASASFSTGSTITSYAWTQTSGPSCTITSPSSVNTTVTGMSTVGSYFFHVVVTDANGSAGSANVTVIVAAAIPVNCNCGIPNFKYSNKR